jgi:hypothetical protein
MCLNLFATGLPKHAVDDFAKAQVPKANPTPSSPLSMLQSSSTVCGLMPVHGGLIHTLARAQTDLVCCQYKKRQT